MQTSPFNLKGVVYLGATQMSSCLYSLSLSGSFTMNAAISAALSGKTEILEFGAFCPGSQIVGGNFTVKNAGNSVEAKP